MISNYSHNHAISSFPNVLEVLVPRAHFKHLASYNFGIRIIGTSGCSSFGHCDAQKIGKPLNHRANVYSMFLSLYFEFQNPIYHRSPSIIQIVSINSQYLTNDKPKQTAISDLHYPLAKQFAYHSRLTVRPTFLDTPVRTQYRYKIG